MRFLLLFLCFAGGVASAAVPTSNLCADWAFFPQEYETSFPWRRDSMYSLEREAPSYVNEVRNKYTYDPATGFPLGLVSYNSLGQEDSRFSAFAIPNGYVWRPSDTVLFESHGDTLITYLRSSNEHPMTIAYWRNGLSWVTGSLSDTPSSRTLWANDTLRTTTWLPNNPDSPIIENCTSPTLDSCVCLRTNSQPKTLTRKATEDGFVITSSMGGETGPNGFYEYSETFFRPFHPTVGARKASRNGRRPHRAEFRWNGARPREASSSTHPLELLRHGQIPAESTRQ